MKRFIDTIKNIWSIKELRDRIGYTLLMLLIFRIGSYIVLPGVDVVALKSAVANQNSGSIVGLINAFTGGAFNQASIMALGVMPYITASIVVQLLGFAVPYFQRLQQREGESGRKKLSQITRILTLAVTLVQGTAYLTLIKNYGAIDPNINPAVFWAVGTIILSTGTLFAMWLGEKITDRGIGNGISLMIMIGIISGLPSALSAEFIFQLDGRGLIGFVLEMVFLFLVTMATVLVVQAVRKIPIQFAKRVVGRSNKSLPMAGARDFIPVKLNASGVMPIIFAQALMFLPATLATQLSQNNPGAANSSFLQSLTDFTTVPYNIIYFILIVVFTYVYTALIVNPNQYSEYLKRQNAFIPGVQPGTQTANYIDNITSRITLPGAIFLGIIAIMPAFAAFFGVGQAFALFFGGTTLLIMVGVVLDTLQQIESYLVLRKYDGLVKSGKLQGRASGMQTIGSAF